MHPALVRSDCAMAVTEPQADRTNPLIWANSRFLDLLGFAVNEVVGTDPHSRHSGIAPEAQRVIRETILHRGRCRVLAQYRRPDASTAWVILHVYPACDGRNLVGVLHDWTPELQRRLRTLSRQQERLLALVGNGYSVPEAAIAMAIARRTAYSHREEILRKLGGDSLSGLLRMHD